MMSKKEVDFLQKQHTRTHKKKKRWKEFPARAEGGELMNFVTNAVGCVFISVLIPTRLLSASLRLHSSQTLHTLQELKISSHPAEASTSGQRYLTERRAVSKYADRHHKANTVDCE